MILTLAFAVLAWIVATFALAIAVGTSLRFGRARADFERLVQAQPPSVRILYSGKPRLSGEGEP